MKSSIKYILLFSIIFLLIFYFPLICLWIESSEDFYPTISEMEAERKKPQFMSDNATSIHMLVELDNTNWWLQFESKAFQRNVDTSLFFLVSVSADKIKILSSPSHLRCNKHKIKEFYNFDKHDIIKIKSPPYVLWWTDELTEDADLINTVNKFVFYRSKKPYNVFGYTNPPPKIDYTVIAYDSLTNLVYVWNKL